MAKPSTRSSRPASAPGAADNPQARSDEVAEAEEESGVADELSFREAQTALELCLAQLQDQDLDVETMADLYRRAQTYADRCDAVLRQVEQEVMQWDPAQPDSAPTPYAP
jgi:exodeoxyribonuclease VII small subunit